MISDITQITWPGWETVRLIGRGSFGAVYEIQRNIFGDIEKAALKVISIPQNAGDIDEMYSDGYDEESITSTFQSHLKSIVAEYSMMRKMNGCTNIVNCDDVRYVQHDDGIGWDIFIKMELLTPLTQALPTAIPEETVIKIARDICAALVLCKKHEIVHRDIKPQNIFLSLNGDYKLGDFGIAKTVEKTMGGTKIGTYKYMAPEVYNNKPYGSAADIYSLGLVLYWLLNKRRMPFLPLPPAKLSAGMDEQARNRRLSGEQFGAPKNGSKELKAIVMKACAYNVADRYASAEEMLADLNRIGQYQAGYPVAAPVVPVSRAAAIHHVEAGDEDDSIGADTVFDSAGTAIADVDSFAENGDVTIALPVPKTDETLRRNEKPDRTESPKPEAELKKASSAPKQGMKILIALGAVAAVLILAMSIFANGAGKENTGNPAIVQNQINPTQPTTGETQKPTQATEATRDIPDGTILIDESWENGDIVVVALDDKTLWTQITDDRPDQQYDDLGTPWSIYFDFGNEMKLPNSVGGYAVNHPFRISLSSLAAKEMRTYEYEHGNTDEDFSQDYLKNLVIWETECRNNGFYTTNESRIDYMDIARNGNTYTAIITLPEWFDVSIYNDLSNINVALLGTDFYSNLYQNGSARYDKSYSFYP